MGRYSTYALVLLAYCAAQAAAVTITLFNNPNAATGCTGNTILSCPSIAAGQCCATPNAQLGFSNALFNGLPTEGIPAQGIVYQNGMSDNGCGTSVDSGYGLNLCLTAPGDGAEWLQPNAKRDEQSCCPVAPSVFQVGNRTFDIFGNVPDDVSAAMVQFWREDSSVEGDVAVVSDSFLPYERT